MSLARHVCDTVPHDTISVRYIAHLFLFWNIFAKNNMDAHKCRQYPRDMRIMLLFFSVIWRIFAMHSYPSLSHYTEYNPPYDSISPPHTPCVTCVTCATHAMHCTKYFYKNIGGEHFSNLGCFSSHQKIFMKYHHEMWKIPICLLILENSSPALVLFSLADLTGWQGTAIGRSNGQTKSDGSWLGQGAAGPGAQTTLARWCPGSPRRPFAGWPRSPDNTSSWDPNPWVVPCQGKTGLTLKAEALQTYKHDFSLFAKYEKYTTYLR